MARIVDRRKAIELRLAGNSYSYIKGRLNVSKGTLSDWLKDVELSDLQLEKIKKDSLEKRVENYIKTAKLRREKIFATIYLHQKNKLLPLSTRDLLIAGLFLYLGEGAKSNRSRIQITNTDPSIIKFSIFWMTKILNIEIEKLRVQLHLYNNMDIEKELNFWQNSTRLKKDQFIKPYIKTTSSLKIDHPSFGHGTCNLYACDTNLKHNILAGIKVMLDEINGRVAQW
ncbi:MAG: hypothetical protein HYT62_04665 [Candidatus Yanofskybacteria bacterium]|nr:hypothetical protein [Candidatus Yanofskybacteria bacterium]